MGFILWVQDKYMMLQRSNTTLIRKPRYAPAAWRHGPT
jgi:hypothetical protein